MHTEFQQYEKKQNKKNEDEARKYQKSSKSPFLSLCINAIEWLSFESHAKLTIINQSTNQSINQLNDLSKKETTKLIKY